VENIIYKVYIRGKQIELPCSTCSEALHVIWPSTFDALTM